MKRIMLLGLGLLVACATGGGGGGAASPSSSGAQAHHEKGGGHKGADAKGQREGARAKAAMSSAHEAGEELDGIVCNGDTEGEAWCANEAEIDFCAGGKWWTLHCPAIESVAFCGLDVASLEVDCYTEI